MKRKKLLRLTTADISLNSFLKGQLRFLNQYYDVVGVAADTGVLESVGEREGVRTINVAMQREISPIEDLKSLAALYKVFKQERPDILHANTPKGSLLAMIAGWLARIPCRVYTVTGLRYQGATGVMRFVLKTMERITCLLATHIIPEGNGVLHILQEDHITRKPLRVLHHGNINGKNTAELSKEQTIADMLQKAKADVTPEEIYQTRNKFRHDLGLKDNEFVFIFVGRIVKDKGIVELAQCLQKLKAENKQFRLLLVGSIETGNAIPTNVKNFFLQSECVKYVGKQTDIRPYLLAADALVFPSYREGFPNVPLEAGCMDLPSIVTNINGCNEIIKDGLNGTIIAAHNVQHPTDEMEQALCIAMRKYIEQPENVKRMAKNARQMVKDRFEQHDVWNALLHYYNEIV
ncbi:MAG: glycosyltransferase family 4 protein [Prevotella sp.]|nr:glycosyltransferase family 4 protein [Prevotellaceae bacterium]MDY3935552.1 glycosyltransferase family 4 protein [Prevotella sp.]